MNQKLYSILKAIALVWLPALGTLVFTVTDVWKLANGAQIVGTIMAVDAFLGVGLRLTPRQYDGNLVVDTTHPLKDTFTIDVGDGLLNPEGRKDIRLKVVPAPDIHNVI